ncbi:hypothetical protein [Paenibacillus assamensis]|uniref:hypothetical protein n=1 Tax=Paenibacillus assamensis TaxID=311244 RepID=UPI000411ACBB|nr:hypothetical protein [Paenibacillus assamensis]
MAFEKQLPEWKAKGIKPPQNKLDEGWKAQDKPPAAWLNWQMNSTYEALNELQQHAVDGRDVSAVPSPNGIVRLDGEGHLNEQALADAKYKAIQFMPGVQVVESDVDTPLKVENVQGRTLVNLLGRVGSCEDASAFNKKTKLEVSVDTSRKSQGQGSLLLVSTVPEKIFSGVGRIINVNPDSYYVAVAMANNITSKRLRLQIHGMSPGGQFVNTDTSGWNKFEPLFIRFRPSDVNSTTSVEVQLWIETEGVNAGGCFDALRVFEISKADYDAIGTMTAEQVVNRFPYVEGTTNVKNPYMLVKSGNLLPSAFEFNNNFVTTIHHDYSFEFTAIEKENKGLYYDVEVLPNESYCTRVICSNSNGNIRFEYYTDMNSAGNKNKFLQPRTYHKANEYAYIRTPAGCGCVRIYLTNEYEGGTSIESQREGHYVFSNFLMFPESKPVLFFPQQSSIWAAEYELASNPIDGKDMDILFTCEDGIPYVRENWKKISLDGNLNWVCMSETPGFKQVLVKNLTPTIKNTGYVVKFDGKPLSRVVQGSGITVADQHALTDDADQYPDAIIISVSNEDSGWGNEYTPSTDEIKAYFMGWRVHKGAQGNVNVPFNGETEGKAWHPLDARYTSHEGVPSASFYVTTVPTLPVKDYDYTRYSIWRPYKLQYLKAKPTVESISNYELGAALGRGSNVVEIGSGLVMREKADPLQGQGNQFYLHSRGLGNRFKYLVKDIQNVYRNNAKDSKWQVYTSSLEVDFGLENAGCLAENFDTSAVYHVTYTMLEETLKATIRGSVASNLLGTISNVVHNTGDIERRLSVVETLKSNKDKVKPTWIIPSLMNGWIAYKDGFLNPRYYKDEYGVVHIEGLIKGGAVAATTNLFLLPPEYRPTGTLIFSVVGLSGTTSVPTMIRVDVTHDGRVIINQSHSTDVGNYYLSLTGISYNTEQ